MSSDQHMSRCGASAVSVPSDERQNKKAIDKIAQTYDPNYLLILREPGGHIKTGCLRICVDLAKRYL